MLCVVMDGGQLWWSFSLVVGGGGYILDDNG